MTEEEKPANTKKVPCEICLKEIPVSEAKIDEASGYVAHFCGLDCYSRWKEQEKKDKE